MIFQMCVHKEDMESFMTLFHASTYGGHAITYKIVAKLLQVGQYL